MTATCSTRSPRNTSPFAKIRKSGGAIVLLLALSSCTHPATPASGIATPFVALPSFATPTRPTPHTGTTPTVLSLGELPTPQPVASARAPYCGGQPSVGEPITYPSLAAQTWASEQVVVGTVEAQESRWEVTGGYPYIATYALLRVEERVRGLPFEALFLAGAGGTLDGCTQRTNFPSLMRGERYLLFLVGRDPSAPFVPTTIYVVNGGEAGQQLLTTGTDLAALLGPLRQTLTQPPPSDLRADFLVPLDRAPAAPISTPRP